MFLDGKSDRVSDIQAKVPSESIVAPAFFILIIEKNFKACGTGEPDYLHHRMESDEVASNRASGIKAK